MTKSFHLNAALFLCLSAGLVSPAMGQMSGTRLTIGVQVVEPCTISIDRGGPASFGHRSTIACARDQAASFRTIHGATPEASVMSASARSENNSGSLADPHYDVTEIAF